MPTWNTPNTVAVGGAVSPSDYNTFVRDNFAYLAARPLAWKVIDGTSADYTGLVATSWTDVDPGLLFITVTPQVSSPRVLVCADVLTTVGGGGLTFFDFTNGSTRSSISDSSAANSSIGVAVNDNQSRMFTPVRALFINLVALTTYTFKLQYKTNAAVATTVFRNARPITLSAWEV